MGKVDSCIKLSAESHANIAVEYMHPNSVQHFGRCVPDARRQVTTKTCAEAEKSVWYMR